LAAVAAQPSDPDQTSKYLTAADAQLAAVQKWGPRVLRYIPDGAVSETLVNAAIDCDAIATAQLYTDMPPEMQHRVIARNPTAARYMRQYPSLDPAIAATLKSGL
jgi:hypothetical protein